MGEFRPGDSSIEILGLLSGHCYSIRISVTNPSGSITIAPIIRVQTGLETAPTSDDTPSQPAFLRTTSSHVEVSEPQTGLKEVGGIVHHSSRGLASSRVAAAPAYKTEPAGKSMGQYDSSDEDDTVERIEQLMGRLETLKNQKDEMDRQIVEDDADFQCQVTDLTKERDRLRQSHKEREEASSELRKQGNQLDKANRLAQSRKAAKERELQSKRMERQKFKADTDRRGQEIQDMLAETEEMSQEKLRVVAEKDHFVEEKRKGILEDQHVIKVLEEELHVKGVQLKALEQKREEMGVEDEENNRRDTVKEQDDSWEMRYQAIQSQLMQWRHALHQASIEEQQVKDRLTWWLDRRNRNPEFFTTATHFDNPPLSRSRTGGSRHANSRASTISAPGYQASPLGSGSEAMPPLTYPSAGPYFNVGNGTAFTPGNGQMGLSQAEADMLTGGSAMSPAANELLPSNLFRDEDLGSRPLAAMRNSSLPGGAETFARHAISNSDTSIRGPNTPASASSRPGSMLPSPRDSLLNLHGIRPRSDTFEDIDRHSIHSTSAPLHPSIVAEGNALASNRLANLFSSPFGRQREKSNTQEPPPLGTLKQGQSQSFPRNLEQDGMEAAGNRRRRGSHSYWVNPMANLLARNNTNTDEERVITARTSSGRRSRLNMFGSKSEHPQPNDFLDQAAPSRPSSTYSHDPVIGRPSSESPSTWWPSLDGVPNRNSPLSNNWNPPSGPWSRMQSRRASIQHGSTTNLSIGSLPLEPDDYAGPLKKQKSDQAPIGTRPHSSQRPVTPKLNPAAPTFKTLFGRGDAKKTPKQEKVVTKFSERARERDLERIETDENEMTVETSPSNPRLSRDAQSINTATSTNESHDSFDRSTSGTPSEALTPSGLKEPKESLMQKITRKSSSSKFNVPWSKERGFFSKRAGEPSTPGETDEDNLSEGLSGKGAESASSTPLHERPGRSSISWPNIRKKPKKGDAADRSSEAGEDEEA